jgi:hypothetical protein
MVLVGHEWSSSFDLSLEDSIPEFLSRDSLASAALPLVSHVQLFEFNSINFMHVWCLIRAEQGPFAVLLNTFHAIKMLGPIFWRLANVKNLQKIGDPERIKEIASASFFLSVVLSEVEELKDIGVPWLNVDGDRARTLIATLVNITGSGVVGSQHRYDPVGVTVGSSNVRSNNSLT